MLLSPALLPTMATADGGGVGEGTKARPPLGRDGLLCPLGKQPRCAATGSGQLAVHHLPARHVLVLIPLTFSSTAIYCYFLRF